MTWVDEIRNIRRLNEELLKELKQIKKKIRANNVVFRNLTNVLRRLIQEEENIK